MMPSRLQNHVASDGEALRRILRNYSLPWPAMIGFNLRSRSMMTMSYALSFTRIVHIPGG